MTGEYPSESEVRAYLKLLSNWGRWGPEDKLGTLNLITADSVRRGTATVTEGRHVSCGRSIRFGADSPALHFMRGAGVDSPAEGFGGATDWFGLSFHGHSVTHLDALSHIFWDRRIYNGQDALAITSARGAQVGSVELAGRGIVGRAVLADIPRFRSGAVPRPGEAIGVAELQDCLAAQGLVLEPGDVLLVRTGRDEPSGVSRYRDDLHAGLHVSCLPWLHEVGISALGSDVAQEVEPSGYSSLRFPLHLVAIVAMGLWLLDNADLEGVAQTCAELGRSEFLFVASPLRLRNATGSPVNPVAIF